MNRHAWLQKHPTPQASRGEFHWYPEAPDAADRELRAGFVERLRGIEPPAVLWQLEHGRVAWGQVFSATAPLDGRRYVGLVLSVVETTQPAEALLAMLALPMAAPWTDSVAAATAIAPFATESPDREVGVRELAAVLRGARGDVAGVARALLAGGWARVDDPTSADLPCWIASIERVLPAPGNGARCGVFGTADASAARAVVDRVAELAAAAWREPGSRAAAAWTLLCELAGARAESIDQVGVALAFVDPGCVLTAAERADLPRGAGVVDVLHVWGRGRLDRSPTASTLTTRLADLVALRVIARLATGDDANGAIAEARWYALLPAQRRTALLAAVAGRTASLRALIEAHHA